MPNYCSSKMTKASPPTLQLHFIHGARESLLCYHRDGGDESPSIDGGDESSSIDGGDDAGFSKSDDGDYIQEYRYTAYQSQSGEMMKLDSMNSSFLHMHHSCKHNWIDD